MKAVQNKRDKIKMKAIKCPCTETTFAASATISGSSMAVISFSAGREFATKTTCKNILIIVFNT